MVTSRLYSGYMVYITFDLGTLPTNVNPSVPFCHMIELCRNRRDYFLSIRANSNATISSVLMADSRWQPIGLVYWGVMPQQQPGSLGQLLSKNVPFRSVLAHIFETSEWNNITFRSQGDIGITHSVSDFDFGMTPYDLELFLGGWASAESPFSFELKTLGEKVNCCHSLTALSAHCLTPYFHRM